MLGVVTLVFGDWRGRALPRDHPVANSGIGIVQELRAKRALDHLAALVAPQRDGRPRRREPREGRRGGRPEAISSGAGGRPGRRRRRARRERPARARRVDPDRRVAPGPARPGEEVRSGSFAVEGAGAYVVDGRRRRQLRAADRRRGARVPPSAVAARARHQPAALRARRAHGPARRDLRLRALAAGRPGARGGRDGRRRHRHARPRGADPAREPDLRGRRAADVTPRRARAAAQRGRVARLGRRHVPGQDGHAHRAGSPRRRRRAGPGVEPGRARHALGRFAASSAEPQRDARRDRGDAPGEEEPGRARAVLVAHAAGAPAPRRRATSSAHRSCSRSDALAERAEREQRRAAASSRSARPGRRSGEDGGRPAAGLAAARPRRPRRGAPAADARDRRLLPRRGRRAQGALRRRARDGRRDRARRRHPRSATEPRRRRAAGDREALRGTAREATVVGRISPEGKRRLVEALRGRRPLRRDGRRRRERRARAQGGTARDRAGERLGDGAERGRRRARPRRLRRRAGDGRRGAEDPSQRPARDEALRREVGVRRLPDPLDRADGDAVSAPSAPPDARGHAHGRHPGFFLALAPSPGRGGRAASCARSPLRDPGGNGRRPRRPLGLPLRAERRRAARRGARTVATTVLVLVGLYLVLALEASGGVACRRGRRAVPRDARALRARHRLRGHASLLRARRPGVLEPSSGSWAARASRSPASCSRTTASCPTSASTSRCSCGARGPFGRPSPGRYDGAHGRHGPAGARRPAHPRRLPDLRAAVPRQAARVPRLCREHPEAASDARRHAGVLRGVVRERPPRRLRPGGAGDRGAGALAREGAGAAERAVGARGDLHPQRDRGAEPRRLRLGPLQPRRGRRRAGDRDSSTTRTSSPGSTSPAGRAPRSA